METTSSSTSASNSAHAESLERTISSKLLLKIKPPLVFMSYAVHYKSELDRLFRELSINDIEAVYYYLLLPSITCDLTVYEQFFYKSVCLLLETKRSLAPLGKINTGHNTCPFEAYPEEQQKLHKAISHALACVKLEKVRETFQELLSKQGIGSTHPITKEDSAEKQKESSIIEKVDALIKVPKRRGKKANKPPVQSNKKPTEQLKLSQVQDL